MKKAKTIESIQDLSEMKLFSERILKKIQEKTVEKKAEKPTDKKEEEKDFKKNHKEKNNKATVIILEGDLGSGKTTFVQQFASALGLKEKPSSPTFVISKKYTIPKNNFWKNLIHLDLYRIKNQRELEFIGLPEQINDPSNIIFIEWPELAQEILPDDYSKISFIYLDQESRKAAYSL